MQILSTFAKILSVEISQNFKVVPLTLPNRVIYDIQCISERLLTLRSIWHANFYDLDLLLEYVLCT